MKLPLIYGIPALIALLIVGSYKGYDEGKTLFLMLAMGVALWTAFSLPRPRRWHPEEPDEEEGDDPAPHWLVENDENGAEEEERGPDREREAESRRKALPPDP